MQDSSIFNFHDQLVGVVAHDAGAANHIIAWLINGRLPSCRVMLSFHGPALVIAKQELPKFVNYSVENLIESCSFLLLGTGWQTDIEFNALREARLHSITSISVLDHWTNYSKRFTCNGKKLLPDRVWVMDEYAEAIVHTELPGIPVVIVPNDYLELQVKQADSYGRKPSVNNRILFLMEPIREQWGILSVEGEIMAFNYFIENLHLVSTNRFSEIVIRPHPSDSKDKYSDLLVSSKSYKVSISNNDLLVKQLAWADMAVGCQTYALVIALATNKKVISTIPRSMPKCILPHEKIIHLASLVNNHEIL